MSSTQDLESQNNIFISWSGEDSKLIALKLKEVFEIQFENKLNCFVSDADIASGEDWWKKIKNELASSSMGIICITKENIRAPWIYFEAGALIARDVKTIPLLFNCSVDDLRDTPLSRNQAVFFHDIDKFTRMIDIIYKQFNIQGSKEKRRLIANDIFSKIKNDLKPLFRKLKNRGYFDIKYLYPSNVQVLDRKTVFVSAPMSTISENQYQKQQVNLTGIVNSLREIGFTKVICPAATIKDQKNFDGKTKSVKDNFRILKRTECFVLISDFSKASSSLIELGYAIALGKKTVVFYKNKLPFLIEKAGEVIPHVHTVQFQSFDIIINEINRNKMDLFEG